MGSAEVVFDNYYSIVEESTNKTDYSLSEHFHFSAIRANGLDKVGKILHLNLNKLTIKGKKPSLFVFCVSVCA